MQEFETHLENYTLDFKNVLVVEDNLDEEPRIKAILKGIYPSVSIDWATSLKEARERLSSQSENKHYDFILSDMYLGTRDENGAHFLEECNVQYPLESLMLMSAKSQSAVIADADYSKKFKFFEKSLPIQEITKQIKDLIFQKRGFGAVRPLLTSSFRELEEALLHKVEVSVQRKALVVYLLLIGILMMDKMLDPTPFQAIRSFLFQKDPAPVSQNFPNVKNTALIQILESKSIQKKINDLVSGGLTPVLKDPSLTDAEELYQARQKNLQAKLLLDR